MGFTNEISKNILIVLVTQGGELGRYVEDFMEHKSKSPESVEEGNQVADL